MAKITYWQVPDEWVPLIKKLLAWNTKYTFTSVRNKPAFTSVKRKAGLTQKSLIPAASAEWQTLSVGVKAAWGSAGDAQNQTSFQSFLQDYTARVKNSLSVPGSPSDIVQHKVGRVAIAFPASGFLIRQEHPFSYYVLRKVLGSRDSYEPIELTEDFDLPLEIGISHMTDLTSTGASPSAKFYVDIVSHYQGRDIVTTHSIDFGLQDAWTRDTLTINTVQGKVKSYIAYLDVQDCDGSMDWDNVLIKHSGVNWARDFRCNNVATAFTKQYFYIAKNWETVILPPGAFYDSIYYGL